MESTETWTGHKVPGENWTGTYTLVNPDDNTDKSAFKLLEDNVNANLDPKLHITIIPDEVGGVLTGEAIIAMANAAKDPWKNEYHGVYITNAQNDKMDRGAFIIYSNGANGQWGSEHDIANGSVTIIVPGNNVRGKDDYSMSVFYTYANGYGETQLLTTGFSNNQIANVGLMGNITNVVLVGNGQEFYTMAPSNLLFEINSDDTITNVLVDDIDVGAGSYLIENNKVVLTIDYLSSLTDGEHKLTIKTESSVVEGYFTVASPQLNTYNFYYNQPYNAYVNYFEDRVVFFIREDGTAECYFLASGYLEVVTYELNENEIVFHSETSGDYYSIITNDGIYCEMLSATFTLGDESIVADENYIYIYDPSLGGYQVAAIDRNASVYPAIKTGINGIDTVAIAPGGFDSCINMTKLPSMPNSLYYIGDNAFSSCCSLNYVEIPRSVTSLGDYVFSQFVEYICIPNTVQYVEDDTISWAPSLDTVFCEADARPSGWSEWWAQNIDVVWGWKLELYTYTFELNGGQLSSNTVTSGTPINLPTPVKSGMKFIGWYDNPSFTGSPINDVYYSSTNHTLYARWMTIDEYNIARQDPKTPELAYELIGTHTVSINYGFESAYFKVTPTVDSTYIFTVTGSDNICAWVQMCMEKEVAMADKESDVMFVETLKAGHTYYFIVTVSDGTADLTVTISPK